MGSTDLITFLNYVLNWENESDGNIDTLIAEDNLFMSVGDFDSDSIIDQIFNTLNDLATEVRDTTIAADALEMAADAAAVASFWSFGLSMAAFAVLEVAKAIDEAVISSKSKELNEKLKTTDTDISAKIGSNVNNYIVAYKANNNIIVSQAPKGLDTRQCRSMLFQFMTRVRQQFKDKGGLTAKNFKALAGSARVAYNSTEIEKVYDALDKLSLSDKNEIDVQGFINTIKGLDYPASVLSLVQGISLNVAGYKMGIANKTIKGCAEAAGLPIEEVDASAFGMMDAFGKFAAGVAVIISVVSVVLSIISIVNVVEQTNAMVTELNETIKPKYKSYFNGIKAASKAYKEAIAPT